LQTSYQVVKNKDNDIIWKRLNDLTNKEFDNEQELNGFTT
jgi:hypothetical protein